MRGARTTNRTIFDTDRSSSHVDSNCFDPEINLRTSDADRNRSQPDFCCRHKYCDRTSTDRAGINSCNDTDRTGSYKNTYIYAYSRGLAKFRLPDG